ncbi:hypothetical protein NQ315_012512 [Exocentrus adspersus]|uniref:DDE Tnp4 domain-containing protein n=1 Tax=Exocentrus adspersus TaxID=1586481 RepID=A0AAV8V8Y8_9CUCU|nr:hypothetical protein NQ315_012512 [Exocentrus adspersus]
MIVIIFLMGFPGIIGSIDGCHIDIKQPVDNAADFYNRKQRHSIILQAVCDDTCRFTDVFIGMPGRVHDARVYRSSPLYRKIRSDPPLIAASQHLVADAAYPLMTNVLKPYRDNGNLSEAQTRFNNVLSCHRSSIERAFALLKGKSRRLKYLDMGIADKIPDVILSACILNNEHLEQ